MSANVHFRDSCPRASIPPPSSSLWWNCIPDNWQISIVGNDPPPNLEILRRNADEGFQNCGWLQSKRVGQHSYPDSFSGSKWSDGRLWWMVS